MGLKEIKDAVERDHPDWDGGQKLDEIRRLRRAEKAAAKPAPAAKTTETTGAEEKPEPMSVAGAWALLVVLVGGMQLIGMAIWGDGLDQPDWYNALHGLALIISIRAVYGAYKRRPTGQ